MMALRCNSTPALTFSHKSRSVGVRARTKLNVSKGRSSTKDLCYCQLKSGGASAEASSRRVFASTLLAASLSFVSESKAEARDPEKEVCPVGEEGMECRLKYLAADNNGLAADYRNFAGRSPGSTGVKIAPEDTKYTAVTIDLVDRVESYLAMELYDKQRGPIVAALQKEGNQWVGKYAPGGSSKKESGRAFYNALTSLLGHVAFNGLAPMRGSMQTQILVNCKSTRDLIDLGK